jgi:hypothetical protein
VSFIQDNPYYDPPEGISEFERNILARGTRNEVVQAMQEIASLREYYDKNPNVVPKRKMDAAINRLYDEAERIWMIHARWTPKPLEFQFFDHWAWPLLTT